MEQNPVPAEPYGTISLSDPKNHKSIKALKINCILSIVIYAVYSIHCILGIVLCCIISYALYSLRCILYITLYLVKCDTVKMYTYEFGVPTSRLMSIGSSRFLCLTSIIWELLNFEDLSISKLKNVHFYCVTLYIHYILLFAYFPKVVPTFSIFVISKVVHRRFLTITLVNIYLSTLTIFLLQFFVYTLNKRGMVPVKKATNT